MGHHQCTKQATKQNGYRCLTLHGGRGVNHHCMHTCCSLITALYVYSARTYIIKDTFQDIHVQFPGQPFDLHVSKLDESQCPYFHGIIHT